MKLNTLASPTFGWLKMNGAEWSHFPAMQNISPAIELPSGVEVKKTTASSEKKTVRTGSRSAFSSGLEEANIQELCCIVPQGMKVPKQDALRLTFKLPDTGETYDPEAETEKIRRRKDAKKADDAPAASGKFAKVRIVLNEDSEMTTIMDFHSDEMACGIAGVQTEISLEKGAKLTLVQVVRPGDGYAFINDVLASCAEHADFKVIHLILSGRHVCQGLHVALRGEKSNFSADIGYIGKGDSVYDMNYEAIHTGKKTESRMSAKGVLRDRAKKLFRDSIDFRNGCADSVGNENEDVLLMDETVENGSLPVILCDEENVVGNHGASIGRLDENLLFYMESRGMNRNEIYEMMAKARLHAILRMIPDARLRCELLDSGEEEEIFEEV